MPEFNRFFRGVVSETLKNMRDLGAVPAPDKIDMIFPSKPALREKLLSTAAWPMIDAVARGIMTERELFRQATSEKTQAQDVLALLGVDSAGELFDFDVPEKVVQAAFERVAESFEQPYWQVINETTRNDIKRTLERAVEDGWGIQQTAEQINMLHGNEYSMTRATLVARTEIPDMLNAGHSEGIKRLGAENPELEMGKEWVSIFAQTSRPSHMAMDGEIVAADQPFTLNGIQCDHPASYTLPPKDRCNCYCTIMSSFMMEKLGADLDKRPPSVIAQESLDAGFTPVDIEGGDTYDMFVEKDAKNPEDVIFSRERGKLHDAMMREILKGSRKAKNPEYTFMGGGPASGKGSILKTGLVQLPKNHVLIDPDEVKKLIPEYNSLVEKGDETAAALVHEESSILAKLASAKAVDTSRNVLLDSTGDNSFKKIKGKVDRARKGGHRVIGQYVTVDTEEAIRRSDKRAERTGRKVPHEVIKSIHTAVTDVVVEAEKTGLFDELTLYDNNGDKPYPIMRQVDGKTEILDRAAYDRFLAKGSNPPKPKLVVEAEAAGYKPVDPEAADTFDMFKTDEGFTKKREALHKEIIKKALKGKPSKDKPVYTFMGGGPASGKGSILKSGVAKLPDDHVLVDPDEVKGEIPEYQQLVKKGDEEAAALAHEESSFVSKAISAAAVEKQMNVVLDSTGDNSYEKIKGKVKLARKGGHRVTANYVTIPTEEAIKRSDKRAERTGRKVPHEVIKSIHAAVSDVVFHAEREKLFDEIRVYDNNVAMGEKPILIMQQIDGKTTILDQAKYDAFLKKSPNIKPPKPKTVIERIAESETATQALVAIGSEQLVEVPLDAEGKVAERLNEQVEDFAEILRLDESEETKVKIRKKYAKLQAEAEQEIEEIEQQRFENAQRVAEVLKAEEPADARTMIGNRGALPMIDRIRVMAEPSEKFRKKVDKATKFVQSVTNKSVFDPSRTVPFYQLNNYDRPYNSTYSDGDDFGVFATENSPTTAFVHELAHTIETQNPLVHERAKEFLEARIKASGTKDEKLADLFPDRWYSEDEVGNEDGFGSLWDDHRKYYAGKVYEEFGATEVIAMGVEQLYADPKSFAEKDPEYFGFISGILSGELL